MVQHAMSRCVNFLHGHDVVPFLSIHAVLQLLAALQWVETKTQGMRYRDRFKLFWGFHRDGNDETVLQPLSLWATELRTLPRLDPVPGAPVLTIPAAVNVWLTACHRHPLNNDDDDDYDPNVYYQSHRCDSFKLANFPGGLPVALNMLHDHFPPRYEHALHHFHPTMRL